MSRLEAGERNCHPTSRLTHWRWGCRRGTQRHALVPSQQRAAEVRQPMRRSVSGNCCEHSRLRVSLVPRAEWTGQ